MPKARSKLNFQRGIKNSAEAFVSATQQVQAQTSAGMSEETDNPYAYLNRQDFTSEKFKIEITGLPRYYGMSELKKLLNLKLQLGCNKMKPFRVGSPRAFVCFRSEKDRDEALKVLNGYKWKGRVMKAQMAKPCPDPLVKKRKNQASKGPPENVSSAATFEERIKDHVTPLWKLSYEEQLAQKEQAVRDILLQLVKDMDRTNSNLHSWFKAQQEKYDGLPCELLPIVPSPVVTGYRNKCEFTIGINEDTGEPTVGFRVGAYVFGCAGVAPPDQLANVPDRMKEVAKVFEHFVRASPLPVFNPETHEGVWRQLMVRLSSSGQLMLAVTLHPQAMSTEELTALRSELRNFFADGPGAALKPTAVFFQLLSSRLMSGQTAPLEHLLGDTCIYETVCGLTFRISPEAFFQVNTPGAELLYNKIGELSKVSANTTLLDVCCGTGTIGLCLSKQCGQVIGVEVSEKAVQDAKANAKRNNLSNCEFYAGGAEDLLSAVIQRAKNDDIVAVVDPPRVGLHHRAMTQLRNAKKVNKLVYVACDPKAALNNFILLGRPVSKTFSEFPLVPMCAIPVDLFPHTRHYELIICFERFDPVEFAKALKENVAKAMEKNEEENNESMNIDIVNKKKRFTK